MLVKHDNNMAIIPLWLTDQITTANHSNYLVCDRSQYAVCHCQERNQIAIVAMPS